MSALAISHSLQKHYWAIITWKGSMVKRVCQGSTLSMKTSFFISKLKVAQSNNSRLVSELLHGEENVIVQFYH